MNPIRILTIVTACILLVSCDRSEPVATNQPDDTTAQPPTPTPERESPVAVTPAPGANSENNDVATFPRRRDRNDREERDVADADSDPTSPQTGEVAPAASIVKVNLNTATREQFLALPEVTERMAHEFEEYRPYVSIRQFRQEIGKYVDEAQVARYEQYVFVPININESDAETLLQIPGVTEEIAATIIEARPFASPDEFLGALAGRIDAESIEVARTYLASE